MTICINEPATAHDSAEPPAVPARAVRVWSLDGQNAALAQARELVRAALGRLPVTDDVAEDIVLAASELVANALEHGSGPRELRLGDTGEALVCEVVDADVDHWPGLSPGRDGTDAVGPDGPDGLYGPDAADGPDGPSAAPDPDEALARLAERGRGLRMVRRLCDGCGVHRTVLHTESPVPGKGVWFARAHEHVCGGPPW
ncbi:ATP-binding protein [Streptomyces sp. B1866]|uniref:ATP-binding protein n=1 Tax=Streptomyces sp. B1866 TaxID=3075431 RepID=UPI00288DAD44|nr:ATP-binding protein [Streptomyces sp. B1866]MDT3399395.1 ATP-binding protein [Streptomyces sp. B1866]